MHRLPNWLSEINKFAKEDAVVLLVGTKSDLDSKREVSTQEGQVMAQNIKSLHKESQLPHL